MIVDSSTKIASETEQIIQEIHEIDTLSKQNHENVDKIEEAGKDLQTLSQELDTVLNRLRT